MYEKFEDLLRTHNVTAYRVSKDLHIAQSTLSDWKSGRSTPKSDKLQKIADYFGVGIEFFTSPADVSRSEESLRAKYNLPDGMSMDEIAEAMHKNPQLCVLFSRSAKMDDKSVDAVLRIIDVMNRDGQDGI